MDFSNLRIKNKPFKRDQEECKSESDLKFSYENEINNSVFKSHSWQNLIDSNKIENKRLSLLESQLKSDLEEIKFNSNLNLRLNEKITRNSLNELRPTLTKIKNSSFEYLKSSLSKTNKMDEINRLRPLGESSPESSSAYFSSIESSFKWESDETIAKQLKLYPTTTEENKSNMLFSSTLNNGQIAKSLNDEIEEKKLAVIDHRRKLSSTQLNEENFNLKLIKEGINNEIFSFDNHVNQESKNITRNYEKTEEFIESLNCDSFCSLHDKKNKGINASQKLVRVKTNSDPKLDALENYNNDKRLSILSKASEQEQTSERCIAMSDFYLEFVSFLIELVYCLLTNLKYWIIFWITSNFFLFYFVIKFMVLSLFSLKNIGRTFFFPARFFIMMIRKFFSAGVSCKRKLSNLKRKKTSIDVYRGNNWINHIDHTSKMHANIFEKYIEVFERLISNNQLRKEKHLNKILTQENFLNNILSQVERKLN